VLEEMIELHENNTQSKTDTVVADSKYSTIDNFLLLHDSGIKAYIPSLEQIRRRTGRQQGIFSKDPDTDTFLCPANQRLKRIGYSKKHKQFEYKADGKICSACQLKDKYTRSKTG